MPVASRDTERLHGWDSNRNPLSQSRPLRPLDHQHSHSLTNYLPNIRRHLVISEIVFEKVALARGRTREIFFLSELQVIGPLGHSAPLNFLKQFEEGLTR